MNRNKPLKNLQKQRKGPIKANLSFNALEGNAPSLCNRTKDVQVKDSALHTVFERQSCCNTF